MPCHILNMFFFSVCFCLRSSEKHLDLTMEIRKSPDGGWGWVIVVASFFTQFLCYGSPVAVGVLYIQWLNAFGEGKGKTAWVGSLASGVGLLASKWINLFFSLISHVVIFVAPSDCAKHSRLFVFKA